MQSWQISTALASLANYSLADAIQKVADLGFNSIGFLAANGARHSIGDLAGFWFDELSEEEKAWLRNAVQPFQGVAVHAPFQDAPLVSYSRHVMDTSLRLIRTGMEAAAFLSAGTATIHVNRRPFRTAEEDWETLLAVLRALGDYGTRLGVRVGVETGYPTDLTTFVRIIQEVDHPMVGATVDVGHVAFSVEKPLRGTDEGVARHNDYLEWLCTELGDKIIHMHIHDVRKADWRDHRMVGSGSIDWARLFSVLNKIDYAGLLELELEEQEREEALRISKARMEQLLHTRKERSSDNES